MMDDRDVICPLTESTEIPRRGFMKFEMHAFVFASTVQPCLPNLAT